ncbi:RNA polymerase sigma factor [Streptomyces montanisoli]|uniref:Sigma-70 family RNA polymerase sigma factor n=1 Tax=Streptomyces montanisoli TaxID=2798581 RepID=A0A940RUS8_9ACTN|nr:sigma-70 family RNA polymerase sigma factor [Streptomyces montanisoli]MBP0458287.1 sigma-70 family RNA polymerase sigma factor [Streptomyces montanisoli]
MAPADTDEHGEPVPARPRADSGQPPHGLDPDSREWLDALSSTGERHVRACTRLHGQLLRIAFKELHRRRGRHRITGPELDDLAHQAAGDALLAITRKIGGFRGESRFTTWAYKFVVFEVSTKLGRHFWRTEGVPLDAGGWEQLPDRLGMDPQRESEARELTDALRRAVDEVLTPHQRRVFVALVLDAVPLEALVAELDTNRNAIYKTMFDARRKLRARLEAQGHLDASARGRR